MDDIVAAQKIALLNKCCKRANIGRMKDVAIFFDGAQITNFVIAQTDLTVNKNNLLIHCAFPSLI